MKKIKYLKDAKATLKDGRLTLDYERANVVIMLLPGDVETLRSLLKSEIYCPFITCTNIKHLSDRKLKTGETGPCGLPGIVLKSSDDVEEYNDVDFGHADPGDLLVCVNYKRDGMEVGVPDDPDY